MAVSSRTMAKLSRMFNDSEALAKFDAMSKTLNDPRHLDSLHWSDRTSRYADYGLHTRNVKLETKTFVQNVDDTPSKHMSRTETKRVVLREPQLRLVTDAFGYLSLFPLFFRMIPHDSPKLEKVIKQMLDPDLLWTPFGLRSLAKTSPWYNKYNTEHDPPYWRGNIWVNMNFLAVSSLHYYSQQEGPYRDLAFDAYAKLRSAVVSNVVKEYHRTGYLWENYNDETGHGQRSHPFTGWTSLVLLMMSETYE
ncbi:unnamed protein product [Soboliphyme baturini]|uniref:mannosyl-oligosaccharide glucosidase n=1 Tax=Soboliphyme baturini TaxID=241478 RepID=A0A183JB81_9BILA|nr:unnamed protein product [Soboliphyme baturini]